MKTATHEQLRRLGTETGKEYGKLVQKLLAIAFLEEGVDELIERSTQGIDLEVSLAGKRYAFEVKTCEGGSITLGKKDLEGLDRQHASGLATYVPVLGDRPTDEWIFVRYVPGELPAAKKLSLFGLRAYRDRDLEQRITRAFERATLKHAATAAREGQSGLDRVLAAYPARQLA